MEHNISNISDYHLAAKKLQEHVTAEVRRRCPLDQKIAGANTMGLYL